MVAKIVHISGGHKMPPQSMSVLNYLCLWCVLKEGSSVLMCVIPSLNPVSIHSECATVHEPSNRLQGIRLVGTAVHSNWCLFDLTHKIDKLVDCHDGKNSSLENHNSTNQMVCCVV